MATRARDISGFILPVRVRLVQARDDNILEKLALADRIADLPGIRTVDHNPVDGSRKVDVLLQSLATSRSKRCRPMFLCRIGSDSIVLSGLNDSDRHQVLSSGWGQRHPAGVSLYLPRNDQELDLVWLILSRAYEALEEASASVFQERSLWFDDLPRFSRTNLN